MTSINNVWKKTILLRWLLTEWCNYRCPYCPQKHNRYDRLHDNKTAHAFDNYPVDQWINRFEYHFRDSHLSIVLTGGEPMLDVKNMIKLLHYLTTKETVDCIRIDTNASWNPELYTGINNAKIILMCTYHPSQVFEDEFLKKIKKLIEYKYQIGFVNYVMTKDNIDTFTQISDKFYKLGIILHPNPLIGGSLPYTEQEKSLFKTVLPEIDYHYRTSIINPNGQWCYFPMLAYEMDPTGQIHVGCLPNNNSNFFEDTIPIRPANKIKCPSQTCTCLDKYSFLEGCDRNVSINPLGDYSHELQKKRAIHIDDW